MNTGHVSRHRLVVGTTGSGKSSLAREIIRRETSRGSQLMAFDHDGQLSLKTRLPASRNSFQFAQAIAAGKAAVLDPHGFKGGLEGAFRFFAGTVWHLCAAGRGKLVPQRKTVYCDEIQQFAPAGRGLIPDFLNIAEQGRRYSADLLLLTLSPNRLHYRVKDMVQVFYCFRVETPASLAAVESFHLDPARVAALPKFTYLRRDMVTGDLTEHRTQANW